MKFSERSSNEGTLHKLDAGEEDESSSDEDVNGSDDNEDGESGDEVIYDDDDSEDSEDEDDMATENDVIVPSSSEQQVNVEFEAFPPSDNDFQGIVALLGRLFFKEQSIDLGELANWIIGHNYIGSVLKTNSNEANDEEGDDGEGEGDNEGTDYDDTVYGITTVVSLKITNGKEDGFKKSLVEYLAKNCDRDELMSVLNNPAKSVGLLLTERFVNIPPLLAPPMLKCLNKEIDSAKNKKMPYNFTHFLLISKSFDVSTQKSEASEGLPPCLEFINPEDEVFQQFADVVVSFLVPGAEDLIGGSWGPKDKPMPQYRTVSLLTNNKFRAAVDKIATVFTVENMMAMMGNVSDGDQS